MAKSMEDMISKATGVAIPPVQNWTINSEDVEIDYDETDDTLWVSFSLKTRLGSYFNIKDGLYVIMFPNSENVYYPVGFYVENWRGHYLAGNKSLKHFWSEAGKTLKNIGGWESTFPNLIEAIITTKAATE